MPGICKQKLSPAAELSDNLLLAQSSASGDLSDYVLTGRERGPRLLSRPPLRETTRSFARSKQPSMATPLLGQLAGVRAAQEVWLNDDAIPTLDAMDEVEQRLPPVPPTNPRHGAPTTP